MATRQRFRLGNRHKTNHLLAYELGDVTGTGKKSFEDHYAHLLFSLIPYPGVYIEDAADVPSHLVFLEAGVDVATRLSHAESVTLVTFSEAGVTYFDSNHVTLPSRSLVSSN